MSARRFLSAAILAAAFTVPTRAADPLPSDLALVPGDALGFVHVRLMDVWKHDMMKGLRDTATAAGAKALAAFEKQAYPPLSSIDRVTFFVLPPSATDREPQIVSVLRFSEGFEKAKLVKLNLPYAKEVAVGGKTLVVDAESDLAMMFPDNKHIIVSNNKGLKSFVTRTAAPTGALTEAIQMAMSGKALVASVNVAGLPIPPQVFEQVPPDVLPLLKAYRVTMTVDLAAADPVVAMRVAYADEAKATEAEKALGAAAKMAKMAMNQPRQEMEKKLYADADKGVKPLKDVAELAAALLAIGGLNKADEMLDHLPIKREGNDLTASVTVPKEVTGLIGVYSAGLGLMLPAVAKVRMAAGSSVGQNNLKQIGLAMHMIHDTMGHFPGAAICDQEGKALLSWRVAILPFIEQDALYRQFKLDEPWDSENNKKLIPMMPKVFACPRIEAKEGMTVYKVFVGEETAFQLKKSVQIQSITDGSSNTVMAVEAGEPVTWTKPDDFAFDSKKPMPKLELPGGIRRINVALCDGSVRSVDLDKVSEATWKIVIGRRDGMVTPADWDGNEGRAEHREFRVVPERSDAKPAAKEAPPIATTVEKP